MASVPWCAVVLDCDGVLYVGESVIPGAISTVSRLLDAGIAVYFVTNNSRVDTSAFEAKLSSLGFGFAVHGNAWSSVRACAMCISEKRPRKAFVVGSASLKKAIEALDVEVVPEPAELDRCRQMATVDSMSTYELDRQVEAVVLGFDAKFSYFDVALASMAILENDALFICTNRDHQCPVPNGRKLPGNGSLVAAVSETTRREPLVAGKPSSLILDTLFDKDIDRSRVLVVGDMWSDVAFARNAGCKAVLVLTGVASQSEADTWAQKPDIVLESIADLPGYMFSTEETTRQRVR